MILSPEARSRTAADAPASSRAVDKGRNAFMSLRPFSTARICASHPSRSSLRLGVSARDKKPLPPRALQNPDKNFHAVIPVPNKTGTSRNDRKQRFKGLVKLTRWFVDYR